MTVAAGTGALIASLWLAGRGSVRGLTSLVVTALLAVALAVSGFVATDWFPLAIGSMALLQHVVDGAMRGRVMSLYGLIHRGGPAVGAVAMGAAADLIGIRPAVAGGAVLCVALWLWMIGRRKHTADMLEKARD